ncbi:hypothetical protein LguiB_010712 [Lonicera macranthoides]
MASHYHENSENIHNHNHKPPNSTSPPQSSSALNSPTTTPKSPKFSAVVGTWQSRNNGAHSSANGDQHSISSSIKAVCDATLYPDSCHRSLSPLVNSTQVQPEELYKLSVQVAINELSKVAKYFESGGLKDMISDKMELAALESCGELLGLALDHLTLSLPNGGDLSTWLEAIDDLTTWLSAAGTYQETCIDGFANTKNAWLRGGDRRLLQSTSGKIKADIVVALDGSGKYKRISDALKAVPDKSKNRFVIYVKKGVYYENVRVEKPKWNVMMIGDGMDATIVSGRLNFVDGTPTFSSATFAVFGQGFIARDMGFRNTAGAIKHQAVALMSSADQSVFHRCRIDAFQDTLYVHANRQFYRECNIYGTVDFIFGNSAVVIQNSNILPRVPMQGQQNTITAQGRTDPNQNTGIAIQNCTVWPYGDLTNVHTFLGRPWKNYSTTVYMHTMIGSLVDPKGWLPWVGTTAPNTIFYAEFQNFGPGSSTKNRVKWKGLKSIDSKVASKFTAKPFINGDKWLKGAGVNYKPGL